LARRSAVVLGFASEEEIEESNALKHQKTQPKIKRIDVLRQKQYKQKIARNRSSALNRLETATKVTLLGNSMLCITLTH
jgi:uncharacterized protein YbjQ (UPF0145 family)